MLNSFTGLINMGIRHLLLSKQSSCYMYIAVLVFFFFSKITFSQSQNISGIINEYYTVSTLDYCANSATINNCAGMPFSVGDKVLLIQMKGADIDTTNTITSGSVLDYADAGNYEFAIIDSINGCELVFRDSLVNTYSTGPINAWTPHGNVQLISVPSYHDVTISDTLTAKAWDGETGGVLVFEATGTVTLNAPIDVSDKGFRGGDKFRNNMCGGGCNCIPPLYGHQYVRPNSGAQGIPKGEGIATLPASLLGGLGTVANGGGAAGSHPYQAGHTIAFANGGAGGGNYGKGGSGGNSNQGHCSPANPSISGGVGGRGLTYSNTVNKIFLGGGGGVGHHHLNTPVGAPNFGTKGGGILIIKAHTLEGNNNDILAFAKDNPNFATNRHAGSSGGGGGGTVLLDIQNYTNTVNINVKGGDGGDVQNSNNWRNGPGGGGGGGVIWLSNTTVPANINYNIDGGAGGLWYSSDGSSSLPWGATSGDPGAVLTDLTIVQGQEEFLHLDVVTNAAGTSPLCEGDTLYLNAGLIPGNASYLWTGPSGFSSNLQNPIIPDVSVNNGGQYILTVWVDSCPGPEILVDITVYPTPSVPKVLDTAICFGETVPALTDTLNSQGIVQWYEDTLLSSVIHTGLSFTPNVSVPGSYVYYITHTENGCESPPDTAVLTIYPMPPAPGVTNEYVCQGDPVPDLTASGSGQINWYADSLLTNLLSTGSSYATGHTNPDVYTYYVTQTLDDCEGEVAQVTLTIYDAPKVVQLSDITVCPGEIINIPAFTSQPPGADFAWSNSNTNIGLAANGTGDIASWTAPANATGSDITGTITVTPTLNGCLGTPMDFTVTIYPTPEISQLSDIAVCPGEIINIPAFTSQPSGADFTWSNSNTNIGLAANGTGDIASWTAPANTTGADIIGTVTVTPTLNGCPGTPMDFTVTIYPPPEMIHIDDFAECPGTLISLPDFESTPSGSTFEWNNTNTDIGIGSNGIGNIPSWTTPSNTTGSDYVGIISVTPTLNGCEGPPIQFTVTVFTSPIVDTIPDITTCPDNLIDVGSFTSLPPGSTFDWTNTNIDIGIGASGTGDILPWTAPINNTGADIIGTITVTPSSSYSCVGTPRSFDVTIKPTPMIDALADIYVCPGEQIIIDNFTSTPPGADFDWTNTNTLIGIGASGSGDIPPWTAPANTTGADITGLIEVVPSLDNCYGDTLQFSVTVHPSPDIPVTDDVDVCYGMNVPDLEAVGSGTIYWYDDVALTNLVHTGSAFPTGHTSVGSYTYYVTQIENNCESLPGTVTLTIYPIPNAPTATDTTICYGDPTPDLQALGSGTIKWYGDAALTPPELGTGSVFSPEDTLVGTYQYFVTQTENNCESLPDSVLLTINPVPPPPTASNESSCFGEPVPDLVAAGTGLIQWYTDASLTPPPVHVGPNFATSQVNNGTYTYYVTQTENNCESDATAVDLTIIALPQMPTVNDVDICFGTPTPDLTATASGTIHWYADDSLQVLLSTGSQFATGETDVGVYTYYVTQVHNITGCESLADTVTLTIHPIPSAPLVSDFSSCSGYPAPDFTATATGLLNWYSDAGLTNHVHTGNNFASGHTAAGSYTYYVTQEDNNCEGPAAEITLTIYQTPLPPQTTDEEVCFGSTVPNLIATGTGAINWYSDAALTNLLFSGASFATNETAVGTYTYYVTQTENNCESFPDTVSLTIHPIPQPPVADNDSACFGQNIPNLTATGTGIIEWYDNPALTPPAIFVGSSFNTGQTAVGTYTYYVTQTENNCTSLPDTVELVIHPIPSSPQASDVDVCFGQTVPDLTATASGSIRWYDNAALTPPVVATGSTFSSGHTAAGVYTYYVTQTENGCESPAEDVNLNIIALPPPPVATDEEVCYGSVVPDLSATADGTINWYDNASATPPPLHTGSSFATNETNVGTYTYYTTQVSLSTGCESVPDTVSLIIHPIPDAPLASDTSSCFGSPTPDLTASGTGTIQWYDDPSLDVTALQFTGSPFATGLVDVGSYDYYVTQTVNNCESPSTAVNLTIYPIPATPNVSSNSPICEGDTVFLTSDNVPDATYSWTGPDNFISSQQNSFIDNSSMANDGQYSLVVSVNGCPSQPATVDVQIIPALTPQISGNTPFCQGHSTTLDAGGPFTTYQWSTSDTTQTIVVTDAGVYSVTVTDDYGCTASDTVVATFSPPPYVNAGEDEEICLNDSVQLDGQGGISWSWSPTDGLNNPQIANPVASPTETTTYTLTVVDDMGCSGTDSLVVTVHPLPEVEFTAYDSSGCEPLRVEFTDLSSSDINSWTWYFGDPQSGANNTSSLQNPSHLYKEAGTYSVTLMVTTVHGCQGQLSKPNYITVHPIPKAAFSHYPPYAEIDNPIIYFTDESVDATEWHWMFGDSPPGVSSLLNPNHEYTEPGSYTVILMVQSGEGCSDTAQRVIEYRPYYTFYVPSAFTPNGDGVNDIFIPKGVGFNHEHFEMYIYNRWGGLVFQTNDFNKGWDGTTLEGNPAPSGTYTWLILLRTHDGTDHLYRHTGPVTLLRP